MKISNISKVLFIAIGFLLLFLRPGIPGQLLGGMYVVLILGVIVAFLLHNLKFANIKPYFFGVWYVAFILYIFVTSIVFASISVGDLFKIIIITSLPVVWFLMMKRKYLYIFLRMLVKLNAYLSFSAIVTYLLLVFLGVSLKLYEIKLDTFMDNDHYSFGFYFPFTFLYSGAAIFANMWLPRFIGFFREPGIAQFITLFTYYLSSVFYKGRRLLLLKIILFLGFFLSFSTAGIFGFFLCEVIRLLFFSGQKGKFKSLRKVLYIGVAVVVAIGFTAILMDSSYQFSIAGKLANKSGSSRVLSMITAYDYFLQKPFVGHGFHRFSQSTIFENVNLLTAISEIGAIGFVLYLVPYVVLLWRFFRNKAVYFFVLFNYFVMILISQPIYLLPVSIWVLAIGAYMSDNLDYFKRASIIRR